MKWKGFGLIYLFAIISLLSPVQVWGEEGKTIGKFAGYEWGTGYDEITQGEITQENRDRITKKNAGEDWGEELELDMLRIWETEREVGGYELSDITFYFHEGVLTGGEYELPYC